MPTNSAAKKAAPGTTNPPKKVATPSVPAAKKSPAVTDSRAGKNDGAAPPAPAAKKAPAPKSPAAPAATAAKNATATKKVAAPAAPAAKQASAVKVPVEPVAKAKAAAVVAKAPVKKAAATPKPKVVSAYMADTKFIEKQKALLTAERATYLEQAHSLKAEAEALVLEMEPGDIQFDDESGEGGTVTVDRERDLALSAQALAAVEEIDEALTKITRGTYGICEGNGELIAKARLEALPYAKLCIACKSGGLSRR
ncbi:MAG TPA: TraR/DksA C4-type zinc finger protein [Acidimicrobiales bacterium]|nr:TraR/DksA C4-type zinc finger protein [Acidimicrobiales bacterium]